VNYLFFSHSPKDSDEKTLFTLSRAFAAFQALNRTMSAETANVFLMVALDEGHRSIDYGRKCGLGQSTISRYLLDLSTYRRELAEDTEDGRKEAYGLIRSEVDPMELRAKRYYLTPRGRGLRDRLVGILEGKAPPAQAKFVGSLPRH
jgi:DNA-binding MarR family transcriptional regulator